MFASHHGYRGRSGEITHFEEFVVGGHGFQFAAVLDGFLESGGLSDFGHGGWLEWLVSCVELGKGFLGDVCGGRSWKLELVLRVGGGAKSVGRPVLLSSVRS